MPDNRIDWGQLVSEIATLESEQDDEQDDEADDEAESLAEDDSEAARSTRFRSRYTRPTVTRARAA
ncbi:MAG: hypothetical protein ACJ8AD_08115, partial [Gemmatimonadaceae bacterium]